MKNITLSNDQTKALNGLREFYKDKNARECVLEGAGGTGKTFLIQMLFQRRKPNSEALYVPKSILGIAVTHQAVLNLRNSIPNSKTYASAVDLKMEYDVHGNIYFIPRNNGWIYNEMRSYKHIVVDECSQFSQEMREILLRNVSPNAKIYWLGDIAQLPPIGYGNDKDSPVFNLPIRFELNEKIRQKKGDYIAELCDFTRERIFTDHDLSFIANLGTKFNNKTKKGYSISSYNNMVESYVRNFNEGKNVRITSYRNARIQQINGIIRDRLWGENANDKYVIGEFIVMNDQYSPYGTPIAYNGQTFFIEDITIETINFVECYVLKVKNNINLAVPTDEGMEVYNKEVSRLKFNAIRERDWYEYTLFTQKYAKISYAYAVTNYKIQGATVHGCYVDVSDILSVKPLSNKRKLQAFYVGISRPSHFLAIF